MKVKVAVLGVATLAASYLLARSGPPKQAPLETFEHLSPTFLVDKVIPSMTGPVANDSDIKLTDGNPELLWIKGYEAHMVAPDGKNTASQEFMCHNTLSIHRGLEQHRKLFGEDIYGTRRLFTLSYGQYAIDFPQGFAIPILATEKLMLQSKVLNLNEESIGAKVRHKVEVHFVRDGDLTQPMKPLTLIPALISVPFDDPQVIKPKPSTYDPAYATVPKKAREDCDDEGGGAPANSGSAAAPMASGMATAQSWGGLKVKGPPGAAMWNVPPGAVDVRRATLEDLFPFDTTVHYISVHAHPALETLELRDATANVTIFTSVGEQAPKGIGLTRVSHLSSVAGIPVYKDHKYEMISVYRNRTNKDIAAMAFVWCYIYDKNYHKPDVKTLLESDESLCGPPKVQQ